MGFKLPDTNGAIGILSKALLEVNSPYNDGMTAFEIKKDLYKIKFFLDEQLSKASKFHGEEEFLKECEQKRMWDILNQ